MKDLEMHFQLSILIKSIFIGIDLPFRKGDAEGWFASTTTTIESVKNNIRNLLQTNPGEILMQP